MKNKQLLKSILDILGVLWVLFTFIIWKKYFPEIPIWVAYLIYGIGLCSFIFRMVLQYRESSKIQRKSMITILVWVGSLIALFIVVFFSFEDQIFKLFYQ
jgi:uncharacterized membrane protein